jgi:hypothetical protein
VATPDIVAFYTGLGRDHRGRSLDEIQKWPDDRLEAVHDFIQWLFPLREPSPVNPLAPTIDSATIDAFHVQPELRHRLRHSFERMVRFYGFDLDPGPPVSVERSSNFDVQAKNWLTPGNHNHLRITRILKCLATLGLPDEAQAFLEALERLYREESGKAHPGISPVSMRFWQAAVR